MIHLDTSFLIRVLAREPRADRRMRGWLRTGEPIGISVIAWAEFLCGPIEPAAAALAARVIPIREGFLEEDAGAAARLFNGGGRRRGTLADCMIAATALRAGAALATANPTDFRRFDTHLELAPV